MIPLCREEGIGIIPWSPLGRGLLARGPAATGPAAGGPASTARAGSDKLTAELYDHPGDASIIAANAAVASARGVSPAETALAWLLSRPGVTAPIVGVTTLDQLETAVRSLDLRLTEAECAALEAPYAPRPIRGWYEGRRT